jgi:hypothetical protein
MNKLICLKYVDVIKNGKKTGAKDVLFLSDGNGVHKGDSLKFISPQGPVHVKMIPTDAYEPCTWKTGDPAMRVLRTVKKGGKIWCGGVEVEGTKKEPWGMNNKFYVPEMRRDELRRARKLKKFTLAEANEFAAITPPATPPSRRLTHNAPLRCGGRRLNTSACRALPGSARSGETAEERDAGGEKIFAPLHRDEAGEIEQLFRGMRVTPFGRPPLRPFSSLSD